jgi:hypothetical protein
VVKAFCAPALIAASLLLAAKPALVLARQAEPPGASVQRGVLDTPGQVAAERKMLQLLADPEVQAIQRKVEAELGGTARGSSAEAKAQLHQAIILWTGSLILREQAGDPARPQILWVIDDSPHRWHGFDAPGRAASGDAPDNIYRGAFFDGAGRYEITGHVDPARRPAQFTFEFSRGTAGDLALNAQRRGGSDFGNQIAMLSDRTLQVAPNGDFKITIGGEGEGPNHVRTGPVPVALTIRDTLSDWNQQPNRLSIRRLDQTDAAPRDDAALRAQVLSDLPGYLRFWGGFPDLWYAKLPMNKLAGPIPRDGGWGYLAFTPFSLAPDEALVIRLARGGASYFGGQVSDVWTITPDVQKHFSSLNLAQSVPDADGGYTYVVAPKDPGLANWLDTAGLREGQVGFRWQGMEAGTGGAGLIRGAEVVKLSDLAKLEGLARVTPAERKALLAKRAAQFRQRLGEP